jgi:geranylgeranyl diphosphate synthase, type II
MKYSTLIEQSFEKLVKNIFDKEPRNLYEPVIYNMTNGGKRVRPLLMMYACELFGGNPEDCIKSSYGIELFHNFTLLHDDIMDNADVRRGKESVFKKYGLTSGILSGDVMMMHGQQLFFESLPNDKAIEITKLFIKTGIEVCEGQQMDMDFETQETVSEAEYIEMIRLKTAVLIAASLQIGAIIAGADKEKQQKIYDFGIAIGLAFQIKDDYLDSFGDAKEVGKRPGGDITENKKTILLIKALENADNALNSEANSFLLSREYSLKKIEFFREFFTQTGAKSYTLDLMNQYYSQSITLLNELTGNSNQNTDLHKIAALIVQRKS